MGWMRFVGIVFNVFGICFLVLAVLSVAFGTLFGSADESTVGTFVGGMMGTVGAIANFVAAMVMFFFGAVLLGLRRMVQESIRTREAVAALSAQRSDVARLEGPVHGDAKGRLEGSL